MKNEGLPSHSRLVEIALANPVATLVKLGTATYRLALPLAALFLLVKFRRRRPIEVWLLTSGVAYAFSSTFFHAALLMAEPRYIVETIPFLELALFTILARWNERRRDAAVDTPT